jgi:MFS family permease
MLVMRDLPRAVKALIGVRLINQLGAYVMSFLAVLAGPRLAAAALAVFGLAALAVFGLAALASRWIGGLLLDRFAPRTLIVFGLASTGAGLLLLAAARGSGEFLAAVALVGLAFEIYEPATQESLARVGGRRSDLYGLLGTLAVAVGAIGGLLAAVLLPLGPRWFAFFGSSWGVAQPAVPGLVALAGAAMPVGAVAFLLAPVLLHRPGRRRPIDPGAAGTGAAGAARRHETGGGVRSP